MLSKDAEERIKTALSDLRPHRLDSHTLKTKRLTFRLQDEEFTEIKETAEALGISITEYFCALHRYAVQRLDLEPEGGEWVHPSSSESGGNRPNRGV